MRLKIVFSNFQSQPFIIIALGAIHLPKYAYVRVMYATLGYEL